MSTTQESEEGIEFFGIPGDAESEAAFEVLKVLTNIRIQRYPISEGARKFVHIPFLSVPGELRFVGVRGMKAFVARQQGIPLEA